MGKMFLASKRVNKGITNRDRFWVLQIEQEGLQIGTTLGISNCGKKITNRGRDFKSGQRDLQSGQRFQIGARGISNSGQEL